MTVTTKLLRSNRSAQVLGRNCSRCLRQPAPDARVMVRKAAQTGLSILLLIWLGMAPTVGDAQQGPSIAFVDSICFGGRTATLNGQGFLPGDTVYIEALPPIPRHLPVPDSQPSGTVRLTTVTTDSGGRFVVQLALVNPTTGRPFGGSRPDDMEYYAVLAFPASFDGRSEETVSRAPKAVCAAAPEGATPVARTLPVGLPATGIGHRADTSADRAELVVTGLSLAACLGLFGVTWWASSRRAP